MNLQYLFEIQDGLDRHIEDEHPEVKGQDNLDWKILALQVELGECANEWRGFKKWSNNQEPSKFIHTTQGATIENAEFFECMNDDCKQISYKEDFDNLFEPDYDVCPKCQEGAVYAFRKKYPLLEEYVDCLHFILSIGLELGYQNVSLYRLQSSEDAITEFNLLIANVSGMWLSSTTKHGMKFRIKEDYRKVFSIFVSLGEMLGFTWEQIEQAYLEKNKVNHERQVNGY